MSFRRSLLQLAGRKVSDPTVFGKPERICPIFQRLPKNDVWEFESSQPSQAFVSTGMRRNEGGVSESPRPRPVAHSAPAALRRPLAGSPTMPHLRLGRLHTDLLEPHRRHPFRLIPLGRRFGSGCHEPSDPKRKVSSQASRAVRKNGASEGRSGYGGRPIMKRGALDRLAHIETEARKMARSGEYRNSGSIYLNFVE
jgi:hypothetical protein